MAKIFIVLALFMILPSVIVTLCLGIVVYIIFKKIGIIYSQTEAENQKKEIFDKMAHDCSAKESRNNEELTFKYKNHKIDIGVNKLFTAGSLYISLSNCFEYPWALIINNDYKYYYYKTKYINAVLMGLSVTELKKGDAKYSLMTKNEQLIGVINRKKNEIIETIIESRKAIDFVNIEIYDNNLIYKTPYYWNDSKINAVNLNKVEKSLNQLNLKLGEYCNVSR